MVSPIAIAAIKYVLAREGKEIAQLDGDSIQEFAKRGMVRDSDLVWKLGEKDWTAAKDRDDLKESLKEQAEFNVAIDNKVMDQVIKHSELNEMLENPDVAAERVRVWRPGMSEWENVTKSADFPQFNTDNKNEVDGDEEEQRYSSTLRMSLPNKPPTPWDDLKRGR